MSVRLSIGIPVYNGENFLTEAIESILAQTYAEFELVISDNGSTDSTPRICERFAAADGRVRFVRHEQNRGAGWNYEQVRALATGEEFFKWAAHDDVLAPTFVERCIETLDANPGAVIAYSGVAAIDDRGELTRLKHRQVGATESSPSGRFRQVVMSDGNCNAVFGVIRRSALEQTRGQGDYIASDKVLLAELALQGPFIEIPEVLFFNREHRARSVQVTDGELRQLSAWFAPAKPEQFMPYWRVWREYLNAARRADLSTSERRRAYRQLPWYMLRYGGRLVGDLKFAARRVLRPWRKPSAETATT